MSNSLLHQIWYRNILCFWFALRRWLVRGGGGCLGVWILAHFINGCKLWWWCLATRVTRASVTGIIVRRYRTWRNLCFESHKRTWRYAPVFKLAREPNYKLCSMRLRHSIAYTLTARLYVFQYSNIPNIHVLRSSHESHRYPTDSKGRL